MNDSTVANSKENTEEFLFDEEENNRISLGLTEDQAEDYLEFG